MGRAFSVYVMASRSRRLYIGVTNNLGRRVREHKSLSVRCFTRRYQMTRLVYAGQIPDIRTALAREKQLKGWSRSKKVALVESLNLGGKTWHRSGHSLGMRYEENLRDPSLPSG